MAATSSIMLALGGLAGSFELPNVSDNKLVCSSDYNDQPLLMMFVCNHCPFVLHILPQMVAGK